MKFSESRSRAPPAVAHLRRSPCVLQDVYCNLCGAVIGKLVEEQTPADHIPAGSATNQHVITNLKPVALNAALLQVSK